MAKKLISASIATAQTIEAGHVSQSIKALTGTEAYDITISGSLEITGSTDINGVLSIPGFSNVSASLATSFDGFPFTGSAGLLGTLNVNGPAGHITASGNISGSGEIKASKLFIDEKAAIDTYVSSLTELTLNPDATWDAIRLHRDGSPKPINLNGAVTASANISVTGNVSASNTVFGVTGSFNQISSNPANPKTNITMGNSNIEIGNTSTAASLGSTSFPFLTNAGSTNFQGIIAAANYLVGSGSLGLLGTVPTTSTIRMGGPALFGDPFTVDLFVNGNVTSSANISASGDLVGGGLNVVGVSRISSSNSSIVSVLTENDSHPFITGVTTTGPNFRMNLADANSSGSAYMAFGRQTGNFGGTGFTAHYATGSNASQGEIIMSIGKNGQLGQIQDRFIVQSEPGPIGSNTFSELSLFAGTHVNNLRVVQGVVQNGTGDFANFTAGNQDIATGFKKHVFLQYSFNNTSSFVGFASSSLNTGSTARNFNADSIPFGIEAGVSDSDTALFVDRGGGFGANQPITASFEISRGGSINMEGHITASGNISASGHLVVDEILTPTFKLITPVDKAASGAPLIKTTGQIDNQTAIISLGDPDGGDTESHIRIKPGQGEVIFQGMETTITGSITTTTFGLFQGGKPIVTHTSSPISSSLPNAGKYHIVGGTLTASIVLDSTAPIGAEYEFFQTSSVGQFLFESASGTTVISKNGSMRLAQQGSSAVLKKISTTTFHLMGDLT